MRARRTALSLALALLLAACRSTADRAETTSTSTSPSTTAATASTTTTTTATTTTAPAALPDWPTYGGHSSRSAAAAADQSFSTVAEGWATGGLDGDVYAQPLLVGDLVVVATEGDSVYAFNRRTGQQAWRAQLGRPLDGSTLPCGNINPSGITATPVADPATKTVYVLPNLADGPHHDLVAVDLSNGAVRWRRPLDPPGLSPRLEQARAALTLANGRVYAAFGGLAGDCGQYKGAVVSLAANGQGDTAAFVVPTTREGGIWAPPGPMVGEDGTLYVAIGNTEGQATFDDGNAVVRLTPDLRQADFFAPADWAKLNNGDTDLGSTSPVPVGTGTRLFVAGKSGLGYLLDPSKLGGIGHPVFQGTVCGEAIGGAAVTGTTVVVSCADGIVAVTVRGDSFKVAWRRSATLPGPPIIVRGAAWWTDRDGLHAVALNNGAVRGTWAVGAVTRFTSAASDGAHVVVAGGGRVHSFDLR